MEENLYWAVVHTRWIEPQGWALTRGAFFGTLPLLLRWIIPPMARRALLKEMQGHGMGRHSEEDIHAIGRRDITALADFLENKRYFLGDAPCSLDATAYAFLANLLWVPIGSALQRHAQQYPQLQAYCERMRHQYYP